MKIALIPINEAGNSIAATLQSAFTVDGDSVAVTLPRTAVATHWHDYDAFVFIGAMGICVRTIAPFVEDKHTDPAVVCVDSLGKNAVSVLSGHIGGANDLTRRIAAILQAHEVITTQSDNAGLWALDTLEQRFDWPIASDKDDMNACIFAFVNRQPTALLLEARDKGTDYLEATLPPHVTRIQDLSEARNYRLLIIVSPFVHHLPEGIPAIQYIPRMLTIGIGLAHQAPVDTVLPSLDECLLQHRIRREGAHFATIDIKADEPVIRQLQAEGHTVRTFTDDELAQVEDLLDSLGVNLETNLHFDNFG